MLQDSANKCCYREKRQDSHSLNRHHLCTLRKTNPTKSLQLGPATAVSMFGLVYLIKIMAVFLTSKCYSLVDSYGTRNLFSSQSRTSGSRCWVREEFRIFKKFHMLIPIQSLDLIYITPHWNNSSGSKLHEN